MSEQAIKYLRENKDTYPVAVLEKTLLDAGYAPFDVAESRAVVFGGLNSAPAIKASFWDFHSRKIYTTTSEKWKDFLFGGFAPCLWFVFEKLVDDILGLRYDSEILLFIGGIIAFIIAFFFLWNRRRYISAGLLCSIFITPWVLELISETFGFYW